MVFSGYSGFLHKTECHDLTEILLNESGIKHHNPNPTVTKKADKNICVTVNEDNIKTKNQYFGISFSRCALKLLLTKTTISIIHVHVYAMTSKFNMC